MSEETDREAMIREVAKKGVRYHLLGIDAVQVQRDVVYRATSGAELLMDIYYPPPVPAAASRPAPPIVLLPMAYPDPAARVRAYNPLTSWARLMAASGIAAVVYGAESPADDIHALLRHFRLRDSQGSQSDTLQLAVDRIGLFATSANVTVALSALMRDHHLKCAVLLYGYTMDLDGSTRVAEMSTQAGFVNACAGKSPDDLPLGVPMLFVRAGRDAFPGLNHALDAVVVRAVARNLSVSFINYASGGHGFELDDDTAAARGIVRQVLAFLQLHLDAG